MSQDPVDDVLILNASDDFDGPTAPGEGDIVLTLGGMSFTRYSSVPPAFGMTGDIEAGVMYAGCGVGNISDCPAVADLMPDLVSLIQH